jgi:hypothetical protein
MPATRRKKRGVRRKPRLTRAAQKKRETAIIRDLRAGKLSYRMIAEKHSVSLPTVNAKARKAGITRPRGRRPSAVTAVAATKRRTRTRRAAKTAARPVARRRTTTRPRTAAGLQFNDAFRALVLHYYPRMPLGKFDRLAKMIASEVR